MAFLRRVVAVCVAPMILALPTPGQLSIALVCAIAIAAAARRARALTTSGAVAATVVGALIFGFAGWPGAAALLLFFLTSTLLGRLTRFVHGGPTVAATFEKGGERDAAQVFANGGVAAASAFLLALFPAAAPILIPAFLGALAEANADTWATELGVVFGQSPRLITTLRPAERGRSGAVSVAGSCAALAGASLIAMMAPIWRHGTATAAAVAIGGFAGALIDSLLGATVQVQYRAVGSDRLTERRVDSHGTPTVYARGVPWLGNDAVNALSTLAGAFIAGLLSWNWG